MVVRKRPDSDRPHTAAELGAIRLTVIKGRAYGEFRWHDDDKKPRLVTELPAAETAKEETSKWRQSHPARFSFA